MSLEEVSSAWRNIQKKNFTQLKEICDFLELSLEQRKALKVPSNFVLNIPLRLAQKMAKKTLDDPLLKQFIPFEKESESIEGFQVDPNQETLYRSHTRYLQKYKGRALLLTSSACAMHCRYCFRKGFEYGKSVSLAPELALIKRDSSIHEVILSGGDPLSLSNKNLKELFDQLNKIEHLTKIRIHTRFPVGIPERLDASFLDLIKNSSKAIYLVLHINHPTEIDDTLIQAVTQVRKKGAVVLNQAVLLQGINDDFETQLQLHQKLIDGQILPYYLHQLDRAWGTKHFEVDPKKGKEIVEELRKHLPGYGVPLYVQEISGKASKTPL